jgi:hypothetical protein
MIQVASCHALFEDGQTSMLQRHFFIVAKLLGTLLGHHGVHSSFRSRIINSKILMKIVELGLYKSSFLVSIFLEGLNGCIASREASQKKIDPLPLLVTYRSRQTESGWQCHMGNSWKRRQENAEGLSR